MSNAADISRSMPVRILLMGNPGAGKTGSLACLANAGFKLRVLAFDKESNMMPLLLHTRPECRANIDILFFEDRMRAGQRFIEPIGVPSAFADAIKAMTNWPGLGASKDWGPETVVVLDGITSMGTASMRRAMAMANKTPLNRTQQVWGFAMDDQDNFIELMVSNANRFHFIALSHTKMIGPKDVTNSDDDLSKTIKQQAADLVETRLYPSALGRELPRNIARHFPCALLIESEFKGKTVRRVIRTVQRPELDLKVPASSLADSLPIEDGLLTVFRALGVNPPALGVRAGAGASATQPLSLPTTTQEGNQA